MVRKVSKLFFILNSILTAAVILAAAGWGAVVGWRAAQPGLQALARDVAWNAQMLRSIGTAVYWSYTLDRVYDSLPDKPLVLHSPGEAVSEEEIYLQWGMLTNSEQLEQVVEAVLPYWWYETGIPTTRPTAVGFVPWEGVAAFHVLGRASCIYSITLFNYEFVNPYSVRYASLDLLPTIVHELGHVQGICGFLWNPEDTGRMETANEVATWEVLAGMANRGADYAVKPAIGALRDGAMSYLHALARERDVEWMYKLWRDYVIAPSAKERSRAAKSERFWAQYDPESLDYIIRAYGKGPWVELSKALWGDGGGRVQSTFYPISSHAIAVDDIAYLLTHLDQAREIGK